MGSRASVIEVQGGRFDLATHSPPVELFRSYSVGVDAGVLLDLLKTL
jgi:hypothetical protein